MSQKLQPAGRFTLKLCALLASSVVSAQDSLPFPSTPSASDAKPTLQESRHQKRQQQSHLPADAPNILVIMLDDAGFAQSDTVGGAIHTPTLSRVADSGVRYNAFHTAAISSATRAALLTGRNHHRVGNGVIAELATDWDGYTGEIPKSSATMAEVLKQYGYSTAAFGKWHNTPPMDTTAAGPFDTWPTAYGFEHFYGFLAGETSQYKPRLYRDTTPIEPARDPKYHLSEDLANQAVNWLQDQQTYAPNKPFFLYWTPGAVHGPHQVNAQWADKYKGKFDGGWDAYREQTFARQKAMGFIPQDAALTPRPAELPAWDSLSTEQKQYQSRLMEVYAGFMEHADTQAGKILDELEHQGKRDNTLIFYVFGDNGASSEGMEGTINELLAQNGIPVPKEQQIKVLNQMYGGLSALGGPKLENMYHAAWAWAGSGPFVGTKLVAGYFGGTRTPLAVSWPKQIKSDAKVRGQFHHVNDIAPTVYDVLAITPPKEVNGVAQDPLDGVSMRYTFNDAQVKSKKPAQYFEVLGSRGIYKDGWMASVFGPRKPWVQGFAQFMGWNPENDQWSLYNLQDDYSQAKDVAASNPEKLAELKAEFDAQAKANHVYPIGAGLYPFLNPAARIATSQHEWHFSDRIQRFPEFAAPNLRNQNSKVVVDAEVPANASGVLYALGGIGGGVSLYMDDGYLVYEYNALAIARVKLKSAERVPAGKVSVEVLTEMSAAKLGALANLSLRLNGQEVAKGVTPFTPALTFTASETFDVAEDLGSPVTLDYFERAPFAFNGKVNDVHVTYLP
ncbi:arylsulfatase [Pseudomonas sp. LAMO17WK12:I10]|uniref:arylsulfatase n=1 Tax=unclassified Pseudomonas TaxID=196821 RepID=UPI000BD9E136|nr:MULTISPECIES: arylsulfatase [unclassified Pseudomonas]PXX54686.1 arylsulfatase [Pseudomonas sp. LAMO17WK12:I9]SNY51534.1 arylsulfatase [Pseudomonas sp. LAMO17WK12:I10]